MDRLTSMEEEVVQGYFRENNDLGCFRHDDHIHALPAHLHEELTLLRQALYLKKAGVLMGKMAAGSLIPDHELALNTSISPQIQRIEVDEPTAIEYLRKEAIHLETGMKGWVLVTFKQMPLGWIKVMPGRINNYYPKEWRILKK
jgi:NOL1/NOP2/fmu family ribosome biogenesis protein